MRQRQEEWSYVAPASVLVYIVDWHRTKVWASNCSPVKVFRAEVRRNGAPCSISRRHLKGCVKVCSTWALVDGLILGRQAAWRPGTIVVVSSCDQ